MSICEPGNPEHMKLAFWIANMEAQVWEMKKAANQNDTEHYLKELADCALVAMDAIRLFSHKDAFNILFMRFVENVPKFAERKLSQMPRNTEYYLNKIEKIKKELAPTFEICSKCSYHHLTPTSPCGPCA